MITVFSMEDCYYHRWQADLLAHSFRAAGMPGELVPIVHKKAYAYAGMHKTQDLCGWAARDAKSTEPVLVIDPDFVFTAAAEFVTEPGTILGQHVGYMGLGGKQDLIAQYCAAPGLVAPVGVPLVIARCDLARIHGLWVSKTREIMADPRWGGELNWICDMWAYTFACADLGIRHEIIDVCAFPNDSMDGRCMIHYCHDATGWSKRTWDPAKPMPPVYPAAARALFSAIEEWRGSALPGPAGF